HKSRNFSERQSHSPASFPSRVVGTLRVPSRLSRKVRLDHAKSPRMLPDDSKPRQGRNKTPRIRINTAFLHKNDLQCPHALPPPLNCLCRNAATQHSPGPAPRKRSATLGNSPTQYVRPEGAKQSPRIKITTCDTASARC